MIDWLNVLYNALWILGLAVVLTTLSLAHWLAEERGGSFRQSLSEPSTRLAIAFGFILFAVGLSFIVEPWWYKIGWFGLILLSLWEGGTAWRDWFVQTERN
jgi:hypothetical protein